MADRRRAAGWDSHRQWPVAMARGRVVALVGPIAVLMVLLLLTGCAATSPGTSTSAPPPTVPAGAPSTTASPAPPGTYSTPQEETYRGCPAQGVGGDTQLNLLKNRIATGAWQPVSPHSLLSLAWPRDVDGLRRSEWPSADATAIAREEGRPVITEGYVLMVRHEGPESPNCGDPSARDYHVWLAPAPTDTRAESMIVELTPRVVARNRRWGSEGSILALAGHHVRVAGWLLLDQDHPEQLQRTRGTLWEIHPVMRIDVQQNSAWVDLASGRVALTPSRHKRSTGSGSQSGHSHPRTRNRRQQRHHRH